MKDTKKSSVSLVALGGLTLAFGLVLALTGCGKQDFSLATLDRVNQRDSSMINNSQCMSLGYDYVLNSNVIDFEVKSQGGVNLGFNFHGFLNFLGLKFQDSTAQMEMNMQIVDPLTPSTALVDTLGSANQHKFSFELNANVLVGQGGVNYYYQTPLGTLTENTIRNTVSSAVSKLNVVKNKWSSRVVAHPVSQQLIIPTGSLAGVQVGDQFNVYNVEYEWTGAPCASQFLLARKLTSSPVAVVQVSDIRTSASLLQVVKGDGSQVGQTAIVEVAKLAGDSGWHSRAPLLSSLHIGSVTSGKLMIDGSTEIDVVYLVNQKLRAVVREFGFYIQD